jgi:uncharacterized protein
MPLDKSRLRRLALITLILDSAREIEGRTKFQKMAYLANLVGWSALDFHYHNYGPYSETLAVELENMRNNGWLREQEVSTVRDRVLYDYSFGKGTGAIKYTFVNKLLDIDPSVKRTIERTRGLIRDLNKFSADELEIMATLVFESQEDPSLSHDQLVKKVHELKPRFSIQQVRDGLRIFKIMRDVLPHRIESRIPVQSHGPMS